MEWKLSKMNQTEAIVVFDSIISKCAAIVLVKIQFSDQR